MFTANGLFMLSAFKYRQIVTLRFFELVYHNMIHVLIPIFRCGDASQTIVVLLPRAMAMLMSHLAVRTVCSTL